MSDCTHQCKSYTVTFLAFWFVVAPIACDVPGKLAEIEKRLAAIEHRLQAQPHPPAEAPK